MTGYVWTMGAVYVAGAAAYGIAVFPRAFLSAYWHAMSWPWRLAGALYIGAVVIAWPVTCPLFAFVEWVVRPAKGSKG